VGARELMAKVVTVNWINTGCDRQNESSSCMDSHTLGRRRGKHKKDQHFDLWT